MAVVYVDVLFLLNAVIDYLLLLTAARLAGEPLRRLRFLLAALWGGAYAVGVVLPGAEWLDHPLVRLAAAVIMLVIAYGGSMRLLRQSVLFFSVSCLLGGGMLAVSLLGRQSIVLEHGVFCTSEDVKLLLLSAALCYAAATLLFQRIGKHSAFTGEVVSSRLVFLDREVTLATLIDTGNTLVDPVSGRGVLVAEGERLSPLFPKEVRLDRSLLRDPASAMEALGRTAWGKRFRLLPYRSVGVDRGLLLAMRVDRLEVNGEDQGPALVALSPGPVSDGGGYQALLGPCVGKEGMAE